MISSTTSPTYPQRPNLSVLGSSLSKRNKCPNVSIQLRRGIGILRFFRLALIMSAVGKRKRGEYETSDDEDEHVLGRQVLPVAALPFDFDDVPEDGAQYLFTVRYVRVLGLGQHMIPMVLIGRYPVDAMQVCFLISQGLTIRMQYQKCQ